MKKKNVMIKYFFSALLLLSGIMVQAQKGNVSKAQSKAESGKDLKVAMEMINQAIDNIETKDMPKTWLVRAKVYNALGITVVPEFFALVENPLNIAYESVLKAGELDTKAKFKEDIGTFVDDLNKVVFQKGVDAYQKGEYKISMDMFELGVKIRSHATYASLGADTGLIFNAGFAAYLNKDYPKTIKYLSQTIAMNYAPVSQYNMIATAYLEIKDTTNAIEYLNKGNKLDPSDYNIIISLVNVYIAKDPAKAIEFIQLAKKSDPGNHMLFYAEGYAYSKAKNFDKASEAYMKSAEIKPGFFDAYYWSGIMYFNEGIDLNNLAALEKDNKKASALLDKANDFFNKSISPLEKALEINPESLEVLESLKTLYYRLQMNDKYKVVKTKLDSMKPKK